MISVCVPVLKRYDLLLGMMLSLNEGHVKPDCVRIIDNGRNEVQINKVREKIARASFPVRVHVPVVPLGVAESWNWFIRYVPEERIITNDDILFGPESLAHIIMSKADLVWASGFSCYLIRDACIAKLGLFDETISPGYGYYEDDDYLQRLDGHGTREPSAIAENVDCGVVHLHSQTLHASSQAEIIEHHRRFKIAQTNYIKKWHLEETFK